MHVDLSKIESSGLPYVNVVKGSNVSEKYKLLDTNSIIDTLKNRGFYVNSIDISRGKNASNAHVVTMAHNDLVTAKGDLITVNFINSFNGTKAFRIGLGVFCFVCSNGLWAGDSFYMSPKIKHIGMVDEKLELAIAAVLGKVGELNQSIDKLTSTTLTDLQVAQFERKALDLRFGQTTFLTSTIGQSRRPVDDSPTAWNVLNRTQENVINGGFKFGPKSARKVSSPAKLAELNSALFSEMLQLVS